MNSLLSVGSLGPDLLPEVQKTHSRITRRDDSVITLFVNRDCYRIYIH